ncbi:ORF6C domain protein [compost metagenome]
MSKALKNVEKEQKTISILAPILEKQIQRQDEQGKAIHLMFDSIKSMYSEFATGMAEMQHMVQEVRDTVTLTNAECTLVHSEVAAKSFSLAKDRYSEEDGDFRKVVGKYRRLIWKQLKEKFNVPKYNCIRRIDFNEAIQFVSNFKPENFI